MQLKFPNITYITYISIGNFPDAKNLLLCSENKMSTLITSSHHIIIPTLSNCFCYILPPLKFNYKKEKSFMTRNLSRHLFSEWHEWKWLILIWHFFRLRCTYIKVLYHFSQSSVFYQSKDCIVRYWSKEATEHCSLTRVISCPSFGRTAQPFRQGRSIE